ncbi:MAG: isocitrate lyase/PEP mutase family protein [Candidatus Tectomicrobia bacterium]|nr:isocitrate lyase/PEP mutase family protein [Candidatus Tectomicrobia bacterium]
MTRSFERPDESPSARLRHLLQQGMVVAPFVYDGLQAKIAQHAGLQAVYMTGFGTAAARGYPDVGLLTMSEMVQNAGYISNAVELPVISDADTGYGNPLNVQRTVRAYEQAGVAALHIEDQVFPKKCGFMQGKLVIPRQEMVQKVRAALDARRDPDTVIIARTDALAVNGWDDTEARARAYHEAGADMVFVDGIRTEDELETYAKRLYDVPRLYNGGLRPVQEVASMGFAMNITGGTLWAVYDAVHQLMTELKEQGTTTGNQARSTFFDEVTSLLGLPEVYELEQRYQVGDQTAASTS